jgi:hypothetical protein
MAQMGRPGLTGAQKSELWLRWKRGEFRSEIGRVLNKHPGSIFGVLREWHLLKRKVLKKIGKPVPYWVAHRQSHNPGTGCHAPSTTPYSDPCRSNGQLRDLQSADGRFAA